MYVYIYIQTHWLLYHIRLCIYICHYYKYCDNQVTDDEEEEEVEGEEPKVVDVDEEEKSKKTKKVKQVTKSWSHLNEQKPIWMRKPEEVCHTCI